MGALSSSSPQWMHRTRTLKLDHPGLVGTTATCGNGRLLLQNNADGLLTQRGARTSHAAVVARQLDKAAWSAAKA